MKPLMFDIDEVINNFKKRNVVSNELFPLILEKSRKKGCIVLAPHPDDEIVGCGGTLYMLRRHDVKCKVIYATCMKDSLRGQEAMRAVSKLDIHEIEFLGFNDGEVSGNIDNVIFESLQQNEFGVVFVPSVFEVHPDHLAVSNALNNYIKITKKDFTIICYEVWCPHLNNGICSFNENIYTKKIAALNEYKSQINIFQLDILCEFLNQKRFTGKSIDFAEVFYLCSSLNFIKVSNFMLTKKHLL